MRNSPKVILAGGNGYIGGTTAFALKEAGFEPIILDNFSTSIRGALKGFEVIETDLTDLPQTQHAFKKIGQAAGVIHFAAKALVPESFKIPGHYYSNNLLSALNLAETSKSFGVPIFLHSSSCAVYGIPKQIPIPETSNLEASSPYGDTKIMAEVLLNRYHHMNCLRVVHLRYFNPAGAWPKYGWGEAHEPETHLIPNLVSAALQNRPVSLFGNQYPTPDGSCIRDFIHVIDLAEAHVKTLQAMLQGLNVPLRINVGRGVGSSVL
ncbi:NAD-dependent epimerase/dehydratase family protein, partial [bacterium]|nr:NAD-dependent epimerase/dehydratase family protein [bacterium]